MSKLLEGEDLRVERVSTVDQVTHKLRQMIAAGRLPQGERLREAPLAEAFGVSRNTIRDAIHSLVSEGLATRALHRGAIVTVLDESSIADIYRVRRLLELRALEAVADGNAAATARVERALAGCRTAVDIDDYSDFVEHELEFHAALVSHLDSVRLDQVFGQLMGEQRLALSVLGADSRPAAARALVERYRRIYHLARTRKVAEAERMLEEHLDAYERRLLDSLATTD